jgi:hypothetical protein
MVNAMKSYYAYHLSFSLSELKKAKSLTSQEVRKQMEKKFRENAARPLFSGTAVSPSSLLNTPIHAK